MELRMQSRSAYGLSFRPNGSVQLTLEPNEVLRLSPLPRGFRVLSGQAWLTWKGEDIVLHTGESIRFSSGGMRPVISSAGRGGVMVEILE